MHYNPIKTDTQDFRFPSPPHFPIVIFIPHSLVHPSAVSTSDRLYNTSRVVLYLYSVHTRYLLSAARVLVSSPLAYIFSLHISFEILRFICNILSDTHFGSTILHYTLFYCHVYICCWLIKNKCNKNKRKITSPLPSF